jgi:diguanylate cyclase (GGDEF)-like protein
MSARRAPLVLGPVSTEGEILRKRVGTSLGARLPAPWTACECSPEEWRGSTTTTSQKNVSTIASALLPAPRLGSERGSFERFNVSPWFRFNRAAASPRRGAESISLTWTLLVVAIALLLGQAAFGFVTGRNSVADVALAVATALLVASAVLNARASGMVAERRHSESESFSRLLQALSRSVSPNSVIEAIVHELGAATNADHVAVVQMRPGRTGLDVSIVSMLPGSATSTSVIPTRQAGPVETRRLRAGPRLESGSAAGALGPGRAGEVGIEPLGGGDATPWRSEDEKLASSGGRARQVGRPQPQTDPDRTRDEDARDVANQIAYRLREAYGLRNTLAAPLVEGGSIVGAIVLSRRTGEPWTDSTVRLLNSAAGETTAALSRVYSHQAAATEARTDQLTGLPNRRYFDEYCTLMASRRRISDRAAILAVDVDHFKRLNDMYGHQVGDQVLRSIANAIQISVRDEDLPARYGGEEFMVLLKNPGPGVALEVGERMRQTVRDMDLIDSGVTDRVTVSIGVAAGRSADEPIADIVERADRALYAAKRTGRDRVVEAWPPEG